MRRFTRADDLRGAEFVGTDLSAARFREADLSHVNMRGVVLIDADIDGYLSGLRINGVDVVPLIEAELDRIHPERTELRGTDPASLLRGLDVIESFWQETMERAERFPESALHRSVDGEWSFVETLRHLVFVIDAWFGKEVLGEAHPFHPLGLPPSFIEDLEPYRLNAEASPTYADVVAARRDRLTRIRGFLEAATQDDLDRPRPSPEGELHPPPKARTAIECLHVIYGEEWAHHQFAIRDLAVIEAGLG